MKKFFVIAVVGLFASTPSFAATVSCSFMSGDIFDTKTGAWVGVPSDDTIFDLFSEELRIKVDNSLLAKLDSQKPFLAGDHRKGKIYIQGSDMGVNGRMIKVSGGKLHVYSGMCDVGFGG